MQSIRVPARAWLPAVLSLAMLAGFGAASVLRRYPRHARPVLALLALLIVTEGWSAAVTRAVPRPMREGAIPEGAIVMDLPMEGDVLDAVPQYRAVVGGYRAVNGNSGYEPAHYDPLRRAIADFQPDALDGYRRVADLYVITRSDLAPPIARWIESRPGAEHLFDLDDARVYRLPQFDPAPDAAAPAPPAR